MCDVIYGGIYTFNSFARDTPTRGAYILGRWTQFSVPRWGRRVQMVHKHFWKGSGNAGIGRTCRPWNLWGGGWWDWDRALCLEYNGAIWEDGSSTVLRYYTKSFKPSRYQPEIRTITSFALIIESLCGLHFRRLFIHLLASSGVGAAAAAAAMAAALFNRISNLIS